MFLTVANCATQQPTPDVIQPVRLIWRRNRQNAIRDAISMGRTRSKNALELFRTPTNPKTNPFRASQVNCFRRYEKRLCGKTWRDALRAMPVFRTSGSANRATVPCAGCGMVRFCATPALCKTLTYVSRRDWLLKVMGATIHPSSKPFYTVGFSRNIGYFPVLIIRLTLIPTLISSKTNPIKVAWGGSPPGDREFTVRAPSGSGKYLPTQ